MLAINEAQQVKNFVNRVLYSNEEVLTLEGAASMLPVPKTGRNEVGYTIPATQCDNVTLLVLVKYEDGGFCVVNAQEQSW